MVRLERSGDLVELALNLVNEAEPPADGSAGPVFRANSMFGDGGGVNARYDASAVSLIDGEAQKRYLPVYDSGGSCLCTGGLGATGVGSGGSMTITATYGGVPGDLDRIDVQIPKFPAVSGVPIS